MRSTVCLLVVAAAGTASAQHARFAREQLEPPISDLSETLQPIPPLETSPTTTPAAIDLDPLSSLQGLRTPLGLGDAPALEKRILETPDSDADTKAETLLKLGVIYAQQHRFLQPRQDRAAQDQAKTFLLKTVKTMKWLTDEPAFRAYPKLDAALFVYGHTLMSGKYIKEGRAIFGKLVANHPTSPLAAEAHVEIAESFLQTGAFGDAKPHYEAAIAAPASGVTPLARYRLGWLELEQGHTAQALEALSKVVVATHGRAQQASVYAAAVADLGRAYAQRGAPSPSFDALRKLGDGAAIDIAAEISDALRARGNPERTAAAYKVLLDKAPNDARACEWQFRRTHAMLSIARVTSADKVGQIVTLVGLAKKRGPDDDCRALAGAMSSEIGSALHVEGFKDNHPDALALADRLFAAHLSLFPGNAQEEAAYAEVLWTRADREANPALRAALWRRAATAFAVIDGTEAARAATLAWMNALDLSPAAPSKVVVGAPPRSVPRQAALPADGTKLVTALAAYVAREPADDAELATMRLAVATMLRRYRHFDDAVDALDVFLEHHSTDPRAEVVAELLLDSLNQSRRLDDLHDAAAAIAADAEFVSGKPELQTLLHRLRGQAPPP